ncbi:hypothetical protein ATPR_0717 [Acetobacter tropicalis NBRC 101654]|uniref:Uncharacterized protein n=1 Tax=Acetobacter tropicalis NBRC 101654 TaxID=749388 RepID=F7VBH3_9PROT|nr:hypothetical protein ATPR_0717 [Acetobacter tropicalis NBRC 101654]
MDERRFCSSSRIVYHHNVKIKSPLFVIMAGRFARTFFEEK